MPRRLDIALPSDREMQITRTFDAPRPRVWDCHTRPELVRLWLLGPPSGEMPVCEIDVRAGGRYRYERADKVRGKTMDMGGVCAEVSAPARLGSVEIFDDDWAGGETHVIHRFDQQDEGTQLTLTVLYASRQARDGAAAGHDERRGTRLCSPR
jgi:uncharacterized protein YndB with AHSA1/START domain